MNGGESVAGVGQTKSRGSFAAIALYPFGNSAFSTMSYNQLHLSRVLYTTCMNKVILQTGSLYLLSRYHIHVTASQA